MGGFLNNSNFQVVPLDDETYSEFDEKLPQCQYKYLFKPQWHKIWDLLSICSTFKLFYLKSKWRYCDRDLITKLKVAKLHGIYLQGPAEICMFHVESVTTMKAIWCLWKQRAEDHRLLFPQFLPPTEVRISRGRVWLFLLGEQWTFLNMRWCLDEKEDTYLASKRNHGNSFLRLHGGRERWFPVLLLLQFPLGWVTIVADCSCWRALNLSQWDDLADERGRIFGPLLIYTPPGQCALVSWHWTYLAQIPTNIHGCMESSEISWSRNILGLIKWIGVK